MGEIWLPIDGWEGLYEVSNLAQVRSLDRTITTTHSTGTPYNRHIQGVIIKPSIANGYWVVHLVKHVDKQKVRRKYYLHRLVAHHFVEGRTLLACTVNHKDCDRLNNELDNLEWCSQLDNNEHARKAGRMVKEFQANKDPNIVLNATDVYQIKHLMATTRMTRTAIAAKFGCSRQNLYDIARGTSWKHVEYP